MLNEVINGFAERSGLRVETTRIPTVAVIEEETGETLFFSQDESAGELLDEAEKMAEAFDVCTDDALCYYLDSAGVFA